MTLPDQIQPRAAIAPTAEWQPDPRIIAVKSESTTPEAQQAREQAWASIYLEHSPQLTDFAALICDDWFAAEDVVQLTFERAFKRIGGFTERKATSLGSWFLKITQNLAIDYLRSTGRHITAVAPRILEESNKPWINPPSQARTDPFARLAIKETLGELKDELPPRQYTVLLADALLGLSPKENAMVHDTTMGAGYTTVYRGRMAAREIIERTA